MFLSVQSCQYLHFKIAFGIAYVFSDLCLHLLVQLIYLPTYLRLYCYIGIEPCYGADVFEFKCSAREVDDG